MSKNISKKKERIDGHMTSFVKFVTIVQWSKGSVNEEMYFSLSTRLSSMLLF